MSKIFNDIYENIKTLKESFYHKIIILFCIYLFSNYIFDRIDHDELYGVFHEKPFLTINIPKNTTFKLFISIILVFASQWVYINIIKQHVYPKD